MCGNGIASSTTMKKHALLACFFFISSLLPVAQGHINKLRF